MSKKFNADELVFVPTVATTPLKPTPILDNFGEIVALKVKDGNKSCLFSVYGYEYDDYGVETTRIVAFPANYHVCEILSELYGMEFGLLPNNHNQIIEETLKVCDFVPCLFSDTLKSNEITLDNCDCMGFVVELPSDDTNYKYLNLVDGKMYNYAVFFKFADGTTVPYKKMKKKFKKVLDMVSVV